MTGHSDEQLRALLLAVREAWLIEGPRPDIHHKAQVWLGTHWPTMHKAVTDIARPMTADITPLGDWLCIGCRAVLDAPRTLSDKFPNVSRHRVPKEDNR